MESESLKTLIKKSLEYYDNLNRKFKEKYPRSEYQTLLKNNNISIIDSNDKVVYDSPSETLGIFILSSNTWIWSWMIPYLNLEVTNIARSLLNYGLKLEPLSNLEEHYFLKTSLVNSRIKLETRTELDIHLALMLYLSKNKYNYLLELEDTINDEKGKEFKQKVYVVFK